MSEDLTPTPPRPAPQKSPLGQGRTIPPRLLANARELRVRQTPVEAVLWECLRGRKLGGLKFRRQHPVGRFILDFYCHEARLSIELDGDHHFGRQRYDQMRTAQLRALGVRELRFLNEMIDVQLEAVLQAIWEAASLSPQPPRPPGEAEQAREAPSAHPPHSPHTLPPLSAQERGTGGEAPPSAEAMESSAHGAGNDS